MTTSLDVPGLLPCAINGHEYLIDPTYGRQTVPVMRQQADTSPEAGEQSLNPQGLWRRSQESWHHGAGQDFLDGHLGDTPPDPHRYRSSKGMDIWTKGQISLLHPTLKTWSTASTNLHLAVVHSVAGSVFYLAVADGTEVYINALPFSVNSVPPTGWTATNATIAASPANTGWMRVTATASAAVTVTSPTGTSGAPVDPGRRYAFHARSVNISGSGGKTPQVAISWYNGAGTLISTTTPVAAGAADTTSQTAISDAIAPATAAFAAIVISWTANWTNTDVHDTVAELVPYDLVSIVGSQNSLWSSIAINAGQAAQTVQSLATDGSYLWAALGTSGLHRWREGVGSSTADVPAAPASGQVSLVGYANGFLLAAGSAGVTATLQNTLWLVNDPLGTPSLSVIKTHPNTNFVWTGIGPGRSCVYAWGNAGGNGEVYKILFDPNTGALSTAASFATYLPDGETIHALQFYAGGIIMGTGRGVRIGTADGQGNIDYGPLIRTDWPVRCLEPQDRYCWFGWTKYDTTNSGLGRIDLGFLTDTLTPAWASDLMTGDSSGGDVVSAVTFSPYGYTTLANNPPVRVFSVAGKGVYIEDPASRVLSSTLDTGTIRFSTSEPKTTRSVDVRHHALPAGGPVTVEMQRDTSGTWEAIGSSSTTGSYGPAAPLSLLDETAEAMELRFTLDRPDPDGVDFTRSPELTRWTAKVLPTPSTVDEVFILTLHMKEYIVTSSGTKKYQDVPAEVTFLKGLERSREIIDFQLGSETFEGYVAQSQWTGTNWNNPKREFAEGKLQVQMMTVRG